MNLWRWISHRPDGTRRSVFTYPGDLLIIVSGQDPALVRKYGAIDRSYYVGLGSAVLIGATIAAFGLGAATFIAWNPGWQTLGIAAGMYFVVITLIDRWLVSDPKAGWGVPSPESSIPTKIFSFLANFFTEVIKAAPRIALIYVASLLFAGYFLMMIYSNEISDQIRVMSAEQQADSTNRFEAEWKAKSEATQTDLKAQSDNLKGLTDKATGLENILKPYYDRQQALQASYQYYYSYRCVIAGVYQTCWEKSDMATQVEADIERVKKDNGVSADDRNRYVRLEEYDQLRLKRDDANQNGMLLDANGNAINANIRTIQSEVKDEMKGTDPVQLDGLALRQKAMDRLLVPNASACHVDDPSIVIGTNSSGKSCINPYNSHVKEQYTLVQFFLLFLEMLAISMKFVRAILPRSGYASEMAARDVEVSLRSNERVERAKSELRQSVRILRDQERIISDISATERETLSREVARHRRLFRLDEVAARIKKAAHPHQSRGRNRIGETDIKDYFGESDADSTLFAGAASGQPTNNVRGDDHLYD